LVSNILHAIKLLHIEQSDASPAPIRTLAAAKWC
jgi:hypothetical protein